jgi:hypothetical protein
VVPAGTFGAAVRTQLAGTRRRSHAVAFRRGAESETLIVVAAQRHVLGFTPSIALIMQRWFRLRG